MERQTRFVTCIVLLACGGRSSLDESTGDAGTVGEGVAVVNPTTVDFGLVPCGKIASAQIVDVENKGTAVLSFTAALGLGDGSPYQIAPANDIIAPGGTVPVVIWPSAIPPTASVSPNLYGDILTIQTDVPNDPPHVIEIKQTALGADLSTTQMVAFGKQVVGSTPIMPLMITNSGNLDASVKLATSAPFAFTTDVLTVAAHSTSSVGVAFTPDASQLDVAVGTLVTLSTETDLCLPVPAVVINGTASESASAIGGAFGPTMCARGSLSGNLYCWGQGNGALGNGTTSGSTKPVLSLAKDVKSVAGASSTLCAVESGGSVVCWGGDSSLLGNGTSNTSTSPVNVTGLIDATRVVRGGQSICAIRQTGQLACWGYNSYGQFGNGYATSTYSPSLTPVVVFNGIHDVVDAAMNAQTLCVVRSDGTVQCAGSGNAGMFGTGNPYTQSSNVPVSVPGIATAVSISLTYYNVCVALSDGDVECWGNGYYGNNGNGSNAVSYSPVFVSGLHDAIAVSGGYNYMCAVRKTGEVVCWGDNYYGTLGDATYTSSNVPVGVFGVSTATTVAASNASTCALLANGGVVCWGYGVSGALGNGNNMTVAYPVGVKGFD